MLKRVVIVLLLQAIAINGAISQDALPLELIRKVEIDPDGTKGLEPTTPLLRQESPS